MPPRRTPFVPFLSWLRSPGDGDTWLALCRHPSMTPGMTGSSRCRCDRLLHRRRVGGRQDVEQHEAQWEYEGSPHCDAEPYSVSRFQPPATKRPMTWTWTRPLASRTEILVAWLDQPGSHTDLLFDRSPVVAGKIAGDVFHAFTLAGSPAQHGARTLSQPHALCASGPSDCSGPPPQAACQKRALYLPRVDETSGHTPSTGCVHAGTGKSLFGSRRPPRTSREAGRVAQFLTAEESGPSGGGMVTHEYQRPGSRWGL